MEQNLTRIRFSPMAHVGHRTLTWDDLPTPSTLLSGKGRTSTAINPDLRYDSSNLATQILGDSSTFDCARLTKRRSAQCQRVGTPSDGSTTFTKAQLGWARLEWRLPSSATSINIP